MTSPAAATTARRLHRLVAQAQVDGRTPSVVAAVARGGEVVWAGGHGDVPGPLLDTQYRIGSITKTLTAVAVLRLAAAGRVGLGDRVADVFEEGAFGGAPAGALDGLLDGPLGVATLEALLSHAAGLPAEPVGAWWERSEGGPLDLLLRENAPRPALFAARERFHYSNLGFALLGAVVERVEGRSWWQAVHDGVLAPLGMHDTTYAPREPAAAGWSVHPYARTLTPEPATDTGAMAPAGQLWSTPADLCRYTGFLADGDARVLAPQWWRRAAHPQAGDASTGTDAVRGLGLQLVRGGSGTLRGHTGTMPGFQAACFADAATGTGAVVLGNGTTGLDTTGLARAMIELLDDEEPVVPAPWRPSPPVPPAVEELLGVWHWGNTPIVATWERPGELVLATAGRGQRFALADADADEQEVALVGVDGYHAGERLRVHRGADGTPSRLEVATFVHTRTPYGPVA